MRERAAGGEEDERIRQLELRLEKGEIDRATFDRERNELVGGDLATTHLVKGLDYKLLAKVRQGQNVYSEGDSKPAEKAKAEDEMDDNGEKDIDDEFARLEEREVTSIVKEPKEPKKGQLAPTVPPATAGKKRTRDQILAEMKAAREAAAAAKAKEQSILGSRFKKIGDSRGAPGTSRIERDSRGREVLVIVDEDGHEKRMVRKAQPAVEAQEEAAREAARQAFIPAASKAVLGMEVPEPYRRKKEEEEKEDDGDVDIFDGVGDDYDPLAGLEDDSSSESGSEEGEAAENAGTKQVAEARRPSASESGSDRESQSAREQTRPKPALKQATAPEKRDYFKDSKSGLLSMETTKVSPLSLSDPAIQAALQKAAKLKLIAERQESEAAADDEDKEARERAERRRRMLQQDDRDAEDLDLGFGMSRLEDEEDLGDEKRVKLSVWGSEGGDRGGGGGGGSKRKRGPKKKKGNVNSAADVLRVIEQRKKAAGE